MEDLNKVTVAYIRRLARDEVLLSIKMNEEYNSYMQLFKKTNVWDWYRIGFNSLIPGRDSVVLKNKSKLHYLKSFLFLLNNYWKFRRSLRNEKKNK